MHKPKWCLFYDNHTMAMVPDVGKGFDVERFTDRVKACGVDFITFHARCNQGYTYYDTKIGMRHPSLDYDLFGKLVESCKRKGIAISAYFNAGLSHDEGQSHREWLRLSPEGQLYSRDWATPFYKSMCFNTGYGDHLEAMIKEVVENYPVDGLFIDGTSTPIGYPCIGEECVREMRELNMDWRNEDERKEFGRLTSIKMMRRICDAALGINSDLLIYFNDPGPETMKEYATYYECECLPTHQDWGYESLPVYSHYFRTLGKETVLNMTGRFHIKWGDFGGIRTRPSLEYDCIYGLANGMRPNVGGHFHPRGDINDAVFDLIEDVYKDLQQYDPWFEDAEPLAEIAVVSTKELRGANIEPMKSPARILSELRQQFDIVTKAGDWDKYKVIILPDEVVFDEEIAARIRKHLDNGGKVISSYHSGLDPEKKQFALEAWDMEYLGEDPVNPPYLQIDGDFAEGTPKMPLCLYDPGSGIRAGESAEVLARIVDPYFNKGFDGSHAVYYTPPDKVTDKPAAVRCGEIVHFSHPVFSIYFNHGPLYIRRMISNALAELLPEPLLKIDNLPAFGRTSVTSQPNRRNVFVMGYVPENRGASAVMIEDRISMPGIKLALRLDGRIPKKVYLVPDGPELTFEIKDNYIHVELPEIRGYAIAVFEE